LEGGSHSDQTKSLLAGSSLPAKKTLRYRTCQKCSRSTVIQSVGVLGVTQAPKTSSLASKICVYTLPDQPHFPIWLPLPPSCHCLWHQTHDYLPPPTAKSCEPPMTAKA
jgi:hypothetical protein